MKKNIGSTFLIIGTTVGAGMLSLPLLTAACGFSTTIVLLILSWSVMLTTSLKVLNHCSKHHAGVNFTTLIGKSLPKSIQLCFTLTYLLLLYSLMAAYTTQGASFILTVSKNSFSITSVDALLFILIFGAFIANMKFSDYINRSFLSIKFIFFALTCFALIVFCKYEYLSARPISFSAIIFAWPTLLPAFGFQNIVPVIYEYQNRNVEASKKSILTGSLIVLCIYIIWVFFCLAILPQQGMHSYETIYQQGNTLSLLIDTITKTIHSYWIKNFLTVFINVSVITSFICTGMSLLHYLKDSLKHFNVKLGFLTGMLLTFLPPYLFTVFYPKGFILALQLASIFAVIVFIYIPIMLDKNKFKGTQNLYAAALGTLVVVAQLLNLFGGTNPY